MLIVRINTPLKDTSSPSRPAIVKPGPFHDSTQVIKPTGGLAAEFRFMRDAVQFAEATYEYVEFPL